MTRTVRRAIALLCLPVSLSGCFRYVPTEIAAVPVGEPIEVHLSPSAQVQLSQRRGTRVDEVVRGTLAARRGNELLLRVPIAATREGFFRSDIEQELPVAEADVVAIGLRQFSPSRTALLVGSSVVGGVLIVTTIIAVARKGNAPPDPGPVEIRLPLVSFPVR